MIGETRFDLTPAVQEYLREDEAPVRFVLRRLSEAKWRAVKNYEELGRPVEARHYALRHALEEILGAKVKGVGGDVVTEAGMGNLRRLVGDVELDFLGRAAITISKEIGAAEKKP